MLKSDERKAISTIRNYFDELSYNYIDCRLIRYNDLAIFPNFVKLQKQLKSFNEIYRLIFSIFRQGHAAEETILRKAFPSDFFEALITTGLLVQNSYGCWKTPNLALIPVEGLYLIVSLPAYYPTAQTTKQPTYIGVDSIWLAQMLPSCLIRGSRFLDISTGMGIQALIAASRAAFRVVGLGKSLEAVEIARFNVLLNELSGLVEIRQSEILSAVNDDEVFDYVIANPPTLPYAGNFDYPTSSDCELDGTDTLNNIFEQLSPHLSKKAEGVIFCTHLGDQYSINFNRENFKKLSEKLGVFIRAYVIHKIPISNYIEIFGRYLRFTSPELHVENRKEKLTLWVQRLSKKGVATDYVYEQIIRFWKGKSVGYANFPVYKAEITDPLVAKIAQDRNFTTV